MNGVDPDGKVYWPWESRPERYAKTASNQLGDGWGYEGWTDENGLDWAALVYKPNNEVYLINDNTLDKTSILWGKMLGVDEMKLYLSTKTYSHRLGYYVENFEDKAMAEPWPGLKLFLSFNPIFSATNGVMVLSTKKDIFNVDSSHPVDQTLAVGDALSIIPELFGLKGEFIIVSTLVEAAVSGANSEGALDNVKK